MDSRPDPKPLNPRIVTVLTAEEAIRAWFALDRKFEREFFLPGPEKKVKRLRPFFPKYRPSVVIDAINTPWRGTKAEMAMMLPLCPRERAAFVIRVATEMNVSVRFEDGQTFDPHKRRVLFRLARPKPHKEKSHA